MINLCRELVTTRSKEVQYRKNMKNYIECVKNQRSRALWR